MDRKRKFTNLQDRTEASNTKKAKKSQNSKKILGEKTFVFLAQNLYEEDIGVLFTCLGLRHALIKRYKAEERNLPDRILRGIDDWKKIEIGNKTPPETQFSILVKSLEDINRQDLADAVYNQGLETEDVEEDDKENYGCKQMEPLLEDVEAESQEEKREEIRATVVNKSKSTFTYTSQSKSSRGKLFNYFNIIAAYTNTEEEDVYVTLRSYMNNYKRIDIGTSYYFEKTIRKTDQLWCISGSQAIRIGGSLGTYDENRLCLPEDEPEIGLNRSLVDALNTWRRSVVVGKILKVSHIKYVPGRNDEQLAMRILGLSDEKGRSKVTFFAELAVKEYKRGEIIEIRGVFGTTYKGKERLQAIRGATVLKIQYPRKSLKNLPADSKDFDGDTDFEDEDLETFKIFGICDSEMYKYCANESCKKKKLKPDGCPKCHNNTEGGEACRVVISLLKPDGTRTSVTLFQNKIKIIFGIEKFASEDELIDRKPKSFQAKLSEDNKLSNITNIIRASN